MRERDNITEQIRDRFEKKQCKKENRVYERVFKRERGIKRERE